MHGCHAALCNACVPYLSLQLSNILICLPFLYLGLAQCFISSKFFSDMSRAKVQVYKQTFLIMATPTYQSRFSSSVDVSYNLVWNPSGVLGRRHWEGAQ